MSDKLKACPFCGEEYCLQYDQHGDVYVSCLDKSNGNNWNTRPIEDALNARIAELEEAQRWIPVSERMPDNWESVLTIDISKSTRGPVTAFFNPETSLWSAHFGDLWVTHWMPLPEPPIVYGKVCEE
jgi:hypothetical protein